jgi:hypothetical protein
VKANTDKKKSGHQPPTQPPTQPPKSSRENQQDQPPTQPPTQPSPNHLPNHLNPLEKTKKPTTYPTISIDKIDIDKRSAHTRDVQKINGNELAMLVDMGYQHDLSKAVIEHVKKVNPKMQNTMLHASFILRKMDLTAYLKGILMLKI